MSASKKKLAPKKIPASPLRDGVLRRAIKGVLEDLSPNEEILEKILKGALQELSENNFVQMELKEKISKITVQLDAVTLAYRSSLATHNAYVEILNGMNKQLHQQLNREITTTIEQEQRRSEADVGFAAFLLIKESGGDLALAGERYPNITVYDLAKYFVEYKMPMNFELVPRDVKK